MNQIALMPHAHVLSSGERLLVRRGDAAVTIDGEHAVKLVRKLVGSSSDGVIDLPSSTNDRDRDVLYSFVTAFTDAGLLADAEIIDLNPTLRALWVRSGQNLTAETLLQRASATIEVHGEGRIADLIRSGLDEIGFTVSSEIVSATRPAFVVTIAQHVNDTVLDEANRRALADRTPWLPVVLDDSQRLLIGPFVLAKNSACWNCTKLRRAANFSDRELISDIVAAEPVPQQPLPVGTIGFDHMAAGLIIEKVAERVIIPDEASAMRPGAMTELRLTAPGIGLADHQVMRVPRCDVCSPAARRGEPQVWFHGGAAR